MFILLWVNCKVHSWSLGLLGFYTLIFEKMDFISWSLVLLAKPHPQLVWASDKRRADVYCFWQISTTKHLRPNLKHKTIRNTTHYQKSKTNSKITSMVDPCGIKRGKKKKKHFLLIWSPDKFKTASLLIWLHSIGHPMIIQLNGSKDTETLFKICV